MSPLVLLDGAYFSSLAPAGRPKLEEGTGQGP